MNALHTRRLLLRFGAALGLASIAGVAGVLYLVLVAKSLIGDVRTIEERSVSEAWLRQWAEEYGGDFECDDSGCGAWVEVYNWLLYRLHLARPALFTAAVNVKDGKLTDVYLSLTDLDYEASPPGATTVTRVYYTGENHFGSDPTVPQLLQENMGKEPSVRYSVTPAVEPHALALAYKINVWCLARTGRCADSEQAPELWALRKTDRFTRP